MTAQELINERQQLFEAAEFINHEENYGDRI